LAGSTLDRDQAFLISSVITSEVFAFSGTRDTVRVRVQGDGPGRAVEVIGMLPIKCEFAKNTYKFPLRGICYVGGLALPEIQPSHIFISTCAISLIR